VDGQLNQQYGDVYWSEVNLPRSCEPQRKGDSGAELRGELPRKLL
jgi:hypothetical protein